MMSFHDGPIRISYVTAINRSV